MLHNLIEITTAMTAIFSFALGVFTLTRNYKAKVNILWFLSTMALTIWSIGYLLSINAVDDVSAFIYLRIVYFGAAFVPILVFHFISAFLLEDKRYKFIIYVGYFLCLMFIFLIETTKLIIKGARFMEQFGRYEEVATLGLSLFVAYLLFYSMLGLYLLIKEYGNSSQIRRRQIFFLILATIFGFGGSISNFIADFTGIYPYGQMVVWLYSVFVTYGIFVNKIEIKIKF